MSHKKPFRLLLLFVLILVLVFAAIRYVLYPAISDLLPERAEPGLPLPDPVEPDSLPALESIYQVHFIDVKQGDAILIRTPETTTLIDGGERGSGLLGYLAGLSVDTIHLLVATHPHSDHIGGLTEVLRRFPVLEVMDPGVVHTTRLFTHYLELIDSLGIPFTEARAGMERILAPGAVLQVLHPTEPSERHLNDASVVCLLELDGLSFLFPGDLERRGETQVLERFPALKAQVLKVAHHGSTTSSSQAFLDAVRPEMAVIFCAENNTYGFPHEETLEKLFGLQAAVYRTDLNGTIVVHTDGLDYYVETQRGEAMDGTGDESRPHPTIDLNTAGLEELTRIIHIGPSRARQIIEMRPFASLEELTRIPGIDQNRILDIKQQNIVYVQNP